MKFVTGTNWSWQSNNIQTMDQMQGVHGYLDGLILMPSTPTVQPKDGSTISKTLQNSTTSFLNEWKTWDAWTKILLTINIKDVDGLGIDNTGTAVSIWKMVKDNGEITSEMTKINAQEELQTIKYTDDNDFPVRATRAEHSRRFLSLNYAIEQVTTHLQEIPQRIR